MCTIAKTTCTSKTPNDGEFDWIEIKFNKRMSERNERIQTNQIGRSEVKYNDNNKTFYLAVSIHETAYAWHKPDAKIWHES